MISCLMPTFNRFPRLAFLQAEAVESFLRQTYTNSELLICNDTPGQQIIFNHPRVRIFNLPYRMPTLSDKLQFLIDNAYGEYFCRWDDDDISLPWRLQLSRERLLAGDDVEWHATNHWYSEANEIKQQTLLPGNTHTMALFSGKALAAIGGKYPERMSGWEDQEFNRMLAKAGYGNGERLDKEDIFYIYRWATGSAHLSGVTGGNVGLQNHYNLLGTAKIEEAEYVLKPSWQIDYVLAARVAASSI